MKSVLSALAALSFIFLSAMFAAAYPDRNDGKFIQKQTKDLEKEGWTGIGGALQEQIVKLYDIRLSTDDSGNALYLTSEATSEGYSLREAKEKSESLALTLLSETLESTVNAQVSAGLSTSHQETVQTGKVKSSLTLGKTVKAFSAYRKQDNKYFVRTVLAVELGQ